MLDVFAMEVDWLEENKGNGYRAPSPVGPMQRITESIDRLDAWLAVSKAWCRRRDAPPAARERVTEWCRFVDQSSRFSLTVESLLGALRAQVRDTPAGEGFEPRWFREDFLKHHHDLFLRLQQEYAAFVTPPREERRQPPHTRTVWNTSPPRWRQRSRSRTRPE